MPSEPEYLQLRDLHKALNADVVKKAARSGGSPPWLKDYAGQLEDPEYVSLTLAERGLLKDLRLLALRRGNKILNDEAYLRVQLRCSSRTRLVPKLHTLRTLGFLEPYNPATETPAQQDKTSREALEPGETDSRLEEVLRTSKRITSLPGLPGTTRLRGDGYGLDCPKCGPMPARDYTKAKHIRQHLITAHWIEDENELDKLCEGLET